MPFTVDALLDEHMLVMILGHATAFYDDRDDGLRERATRIAWLALMEEEPGETIVKGMLQNMAMLAGNVLNEVRELSPETRARLERIRDTEPLLLLVKNEDRQTETV
jgi:hypothetical protein